MSHRSPKSYPRRSFLYAAASSSIALHAASYRRVLGANNRCRVGLIGYGLMGRRHLRDFQAEGDCHITAVCDVHRGRLEQAVAASEGTARAYTDFRKLLEDSDVEAVVISTPDHWHALQTMLACDAGKDVYVEKPLTLFQREGAWINEVVARTKRVVQVGTQQRSGRHYQAARELILSGVLGPVHSIRLNSSRNLGFGFPVASDGPPPAELDWDMWLGPAPERPYNRMRSIYHFRWYWDYSGGQMTNLGAHHLDIIDWIFGLGTLGRVTSMGGRFVLRDGGETPDTQESLLDCGNYIVNYSIREASRGEPNSNGISFYGNAGQMFLTRSGFKITGEPDLSANQLIPNLSDHPVGTPFDTLSVDQPYATARLKTESKEDRTGDSDEQYREHVRDFLDAIRQRREPKSSVASGHRTATACHLANLSLRLGRMLSWDAEHETIRDDPEANLQLERPYRAPWDRVLKQLLGKG